MHPSRANLFAVLSPLLVASSFLAACGVAGSGVAKTESRDIGSFTGIEVSGAVQLDVEVGAKTSVEVTGDDNILPLLFTKVEADTLRIYTKESVRPKVDIVVKVVVPVLTSLKSSGATDVTLVGLAGPALSVDLSGASKLTAKGKVDKLTVNVSGAGKVHTDALDASVVSVDVSGAAYVEVRAKDSLAVSISGAGKVVYSGDPKTVAKDVSGAGRIEKR